MLANATAILASVAKLLNRKCFRFLSWWLVAFIVDSSSAGLVLSGNALFSFALLPISLRYHSCQLNSQALLLLIYVMQKRQVEQQLRDMEAKAIQERAAADVLAKQKQEEMAKRQRELIAMKLRSIGKEALKVTRPCFSRMMRSRYR